MEKVLEKLWYDYIIEQAVERNEQEKEVIKNLTRCDNAFRSRLNDELKAMLEEYDRAVCAMSRVSEKNAFIKGAIFATRFIFEALC